MRKFLLALLLSTAAFGGNPTNENPKPPTGGISALTGDVTASGTGSVAATVAKVGNSTAALVHSAEIAANAATSSNTTLALVKRDGSGNFSAGTITASLTGHASSDEPAISSGTTAQYWRGDKTFQSLNTDVVTEGATNLYYTNARVDTEFDTRLATKSTTNLAEGSNLYYTAARVTALAKSTDSAQNFYVSQDTGNDANDCTRFAPCKTIGAAVTVANAVSAYLKQSVIFISPPTGSNGYHEDITLSQQGVNLQCGNPVQNSRACLVKGSLTVNLTGTSGGANFIAASNEVYVQGLIFSSGTADSSTFSGSTFQRLIAVNCYFQASTGHAAVVTNTGTTGGTPSEYRSYDTVFENNSSSVETVTLTAGRFWLYGTTGTVMNDNASGTSVLQNGASSMIGNLVQFTGEYQLTDNTATATFNLSTITSGTNPCIVTPSSPNTGYALLAYFGCNSTNTNSITGTGIVVNAPGNVRFNTSGDIISTVTQTVLGPGFPQGEVMIGAGATTGTNVGLSMKDGHVKAAFTTAPTTTLNGNAGTGGSPACTVANTTDVAGKVTLKTGTGSWASGTQCTVNFNKAYGVAPICVATPANASAASKAVSLQANFTTSTSALTVSFGAADTAQTTYIWSFMCLETQ